MDQLVSSNIIPMVAHTRQVNLLDPPTVAMPALAILAYALATIILPKLLPTSWLGNGIQKQAEQETSTNNTNQNRVSSAGSSGSTTFYSNLFKVNANPVIEMEGIDAVSNQLLSCGSNNPTAVLHDISSVNTKIQKANTKNEKAKNNTTPSIIQQLLTVTIWLLVFQCIIHTLLALALYKEIVKNEHGGIATTLAMWIVISQTCTTAAWLLQLCNYYACYTINNASLKWTISQEFFWLFSLAASIYEIYFYIYHSPTSWPDNHFAPATSSIMLHILICVRIFIIGTLVMLALSKFIITLLRNNKEKENRPRGWQEPNRFVNSIENASSSTSPTMVNFGSIEYGAIDNMEYSPSECTLHGEQNETPTSEHTPLLMSAHTLVNNADSVNNELNLFDTNALRTSKKKHKATGKSKDKALGISGNLQRLSVIMPFLWPSNDIVLQLRIFGCLLLILAGRLVNVLVPLQYKVIIDSLAPKDGSKPKFAWENVLFYALLRTLQGSEGILSTVQTFIWIPVGQSTTKKISVAMFEHLHNLSLHFHVMRKTGEILRVQDRGVTSVVSLLTSIVSNILPTLVDIVLACYFFTAVFDLYFGTIVLTTMTTFLVATVFLAKWRTSHRRKANLLDNAMEARAVDSLLNYETVKYYNAENFERKKYTQAVDSFQVADWYSNSAVSLMNLGQNLIVQAGLLVGAILGAYRVYQGEMTVGDFTMLLAYITQLYVPLSWFGSYYKTIQKNFIDMEKLLDLFKEAPQVKDPEYPIPLSIPNGEVVFDNVSFAYGGQTILKNISFKVPAGSTVAIVGPSGSGKSTILRLLFRFYDVNSGRIMIDGQDIRSVLQTQLRQAIGVVPQETVLFNDTVRYNIAYGCAGNNNSVSVADVISAAKGAHIHDHIMSFVDKYETMVGERGQRLSGGEKQRMSIARTLLKNPKIVCLDEATSALDTATERQIQSSLNEMTQNRTTLIVAHRLSTVVHADQILIVKDGEIVERGKHAELVANKNSVYYDMWTKQHVDTDSVVC